MKKVFMIFLAVVLVCVVLHADKMVVTRNYDYNNHTITQTYLDGHTEKSAMLDWWSGEAIKD